MLVDVSVIDDPLGTIIATLNGNCFDITRIEKGIYEVGHFNFNFCILDYSYENIEELPFIDGLNPFGVCDHYSQILEKSSEIKNSNRKFVISITPILKQNQPKEGGWRWHKWGPYIGTQTQTTEYLHDEPEIEKVYVFHVYELI